MFSRNRFAALGLGVAAAIMASVAAQAADVMSEFYGNTLVVTIPQAGEFKVMYNKDKTYDGSGPMGAVKGTWEVKGDQLCTTQVDPAPPPERPNPMCRPTQAHKVGDTWEITTPSGTRTATLKKGKV